MWKSAELPENVVRFLKDHNRISRFHSADKSKYEFEKILKEMPEKIESYITPICFENAKDKSRGIVVQVFYKNGIFGVFSYYWKDRCFCGLKRRHIMAMHVDGKDIVTTSIAKCVLIDGVELEIKTDMDSYKEWIFAF